MLRLGWFSTARGETSRRLLTAAWEAIQRGELSARIAFVFCNRERGEDPQTERFLDLAQSYGLPGLPSPPRPAAFPVLCLSSTGFRRARPAAAGPARAGQPLPAWRRDYDRAVMELIAPYPFDLGVLAGYMLIVGPEMCRLPLINLHPAAPGGPAGTWQEVLWQLLAQRAQRTGITLHRVTEELDRGPPVTYCTFSLRTPALDPLWREVEELGLERVQREQGEENRLFQEARRQGVARELPLVVETIKAFAQGRVALRGDQVVDGQGRPIAGLDLSAAIDALAAGAL